MLRLSNYQYRQLLESRSPNKESETEEVIEGILAVKKYEGKGFTIDFAEILRRLNELLRNEIFGVPATSPMKKERIKTQRTNGRAEPLKNGLQNNEVKN